VQVLPTARGRSASSSGIIGAGRSPCRAGRSASRHVVGMGRAARHADDRNACLVFQSIRDSRAHHRSGRITRHRVNAAYVAQVPTATMAVAFGGQRSAFARRHRLTVRGRCRTRPIAFVLSASFEWTPDDEDERLIRRVRLEEHSRKSSRPVGPHSKSMRGQWTAIFGRREVRRAQSPHAGLGGGSHATNHVTTQTGIDPQNVDQGSSALTAAQLACVTVSGPGWDPDVHKFDGAPTSPALVSRSTLGTMSCQRMSDMKPLPETRSAR